MMRFCLRSVLVAVLLSGPVANAYPADPQPAAPQPARLVVVGEGDRQTTLELGDGRLTMVTREDGRTSTRIVDLEALGAMAADAIDGAALGLEDLARELQEMQFQCRLGQDNRLNLSLDDTEIELDLDQVLAQVADALQVGWQELGPAARTGDDARRERNEDALRAELEALKREMNDLQLELERRQEPAPR